MCRRFHNIRIDLSNSCLYNEKGIREKVKFRIYKEDKYGSKPEKFKAGQA